MVTLLLPAKSRPTGMAVPSFETTSEPESPPALKLPGAITSWWV